MFLLIRARISCALLCFAAIVALASPACAQNPPKPFSRSPYVQFGGPTFMHVAWRTEGPVEPVIRYGREPGQLTERVRSAGIVTRASLGTNGQEMLPRWKALRTPANLALPKLHSAPIGTFQYEAKIGDLKPDTTYYYAVYDGDNRLTPEDSSFRPGIVRPNRRIDRSRNEIGRAHV